MKITDDQIDEFAHKYCATMDTESYTFKDDRLYSMCRALIAMAQEVPELKWFDYGGGWRGAGGIEDYRISRRGPNFSIWLNHPGCDGEFISTEVNDLDEAKAAANEHNRKRVLSRLKHSPES